ncbi:mucin-1-like isoform X2 [Aquila chrysaetos chrysaetos]|uniref:mucin-1-like isoform X2 n=1 Tax=Aquila chrysaetos chrysaetos TaxID=223781 RepID=UPI0011772A6D|nr:mucin-1-like isoform X2 [Aquila chrysaetos chrysaetos]
MERLRFPRLPRLLAAAVIVECCARLCPGLGSGTGSTLSTAIPCTRLGTATRERCRTGTTERPSPAPAPAEPDTAPTAGSPPGTDPVGNVMVEGATTPHGSPSHSPSSVTVPGSAGGRWGSPSTLPGQSPTGTGLAQRQGGSQGPSSLELWAGEGTGATVPLGDGSPGTHPSIAPATGSPALGMTGMSPFVGGLQRLLSPAGTPQGTWQGLPGPAGGRASDSRPWHGTDIAWQGARSAPRTSLPSLGAGGRGGPLASTAQPAVGTGPTSLPATGKGSGLPVPTATASTPGVTSPSLGGALDPTTGVLGPPDTEGTPEHSHVSLVQTWRPPAMPGQPPTSVAPSSTVAAQSRVLYTSTGSPRIPPSPQPSPTGSSAVPLSPTPQPSPGTSRGVLGLSPALGTPPAGPSLGHWMPHPSSGGDPAKTPQIMGGTTVGVGDAMPWAATASLSWQLGISAPPLSPWAPPAAGCIPVCISPGADHRCRHHRHRCHCCHHHHRHHSCHRQPSTAQGRGDSHDGARCCGVAGECSRADVGAPNSSAHRGARAPTAAH